MTMAKEQMYRETVLGFAEEALPETNDPENLASKAGGLPVWLYRAPVRPARVPRCSVCLQPQMFLLQIYCPLEEERVGHGNAFHRMLYVAICRQGSCHAGGGVTVLRGQLPRDNMYYGWDGGSVVEEGHAEICGVCGFWGESICGGCGVRYCGRVCQSLDWKIGHKESCKDGGAGCEEERRRYRFREIEIVTDSHPTPCGSDLEEEEEEDEAENRDGEAGGEETETKTEEVAESSVKGTMQDADNDELPEELFRGRTVDKAFERMGRMIKYAPDQVIRYWRGGEVLWGSELNQCDNVPACDNCGGERVFEFQIMSQLIYYICAEEDGQTIERIVKRLRDDMDWVTIVVYTCKNSCGGGNEYHTEFGWVQTLG